jgi:hypothetical protein
MVRNGEEVQLTEVEATGAVQTGAMRYVLAISLLVAIMLLSAIWIIGAATR